MLHKRLIFTHSSWLWLSGATIQLLFRSKHLQADFPLLFHSKDDGDIVSSRMNIIITTVTNPY